MPGLKLVIVVAFLSSFFFCQAEAGKKAPSASIEANRTPIIVEIKEKDIDPTEKAAIAQNRDQATKINFYAMCFTGGTMLIGLFQLGFFYWQLRLMRTSVISTEFAAKAAELNARAAVGIELPVLRVTPPDLVNTDHLIDPNQPYGGGIDDGPPGKYSAIGYLVIKNYGRTPAFPQAISVGWSVSEVLPNSPNYRKHNRLNHASVVKPDGEFTTDVNYGIELDDEEVLAAKSDKAWLWFFGCIHYTDFLQEQRVARFCWRYANRNFDNVFYAFESDGEPPKAYITIDGRT